MAVTTRVILAEDHALTLHGMQHALATDGRFEVLATARDGITAIALARVHAPDVAVIDHGLPGADGLEVLIELRRWTPQTRVLVVTGSANPATLQALHAAGVEGILSKSVSVSTVCDAVANVASGKTLVSDDLRGLIAQGPDDALRLSAREREVLSGIAGGLTNSGIAAKLSISPKTVETHRASLMRKLEVNSTATLLVQAVRRGLLDL